jgi:anthranilate 1,2-dioxygenase small subunit
MMSLEHYGPIFDLLADAGLRLDADDLENWVECFEEEATYKVLSRENVVRNLPLPLFRCDSKAMLRDRVLSLRKANVSNPHRDCHVTGLPRITCNDDGSLAAHSSYALYQINNEGAARLFSVGAYVDRIRLSDGKARFLDRTVIVDMFSVPTMLSTPI